MYFGMAFPEVVLSNDRSQITSIAIQDTPFCRYSSQQPGQAVPPWVYISAMWPGATPGDAFTERVPVLDPYFAPVEALRQDKRGFKYIYPLALPSGALPARRLERHHQERLARRGPGHPRV